MIDILQKLKEIVDMEPMESSGCMQSALEKANEFLDKKIAECIASYGRVYNRKIVDDADEIEFNDEVYDLEELEQHMESNYINNNDGSGYWVKDGLRSKDEIFSTPRLDATHVVWFSK